jgi:peptidyl-tRNA hydrolase, PTH1 family
MYLLGAPRIGAQILQAFVPGPKSTNSTLSRALRNRIGLGLSRDTMGGLLSRAKKDDAAGSQEEPDLFLIVGLGNPGPRYANTRHNVGFMTIDVLGQQTGILTDRLQANCQVGRGRLFEKKILLLKPITFMNVSGEGIGKLSRYYGVPPERIVVIYDDLDSSSATVRLRAKGGHGGHNGMRSTIQHLSTQEFPRVKIGIGRPPDGLPVATYVLQDFSKVEREKIDEAVLDAIEAVKALVVLGTEKAVSGLRVDKEGKTVSPKGNHQNGKGVKQPKKAAVVGAGGVRTETASAEKKQAASTAAAGAAAAPPQSAMAAAIAAATTAKTDN